MSDARLRRIWSRYRQLLFTQVLIHLSLSLKICGGFKKCHL